MVGLTCYNIQELRHGTVQSCDCLNAYMHKKAVRESFYVVGGYVFLQTLLRKAHRIPLTLSSYSCTDAPWCSNKVFDARFPPFLVVSMCCSWNCRAGEHTDFFPAQLPESLKRKHMVPGRWTRYARWTCAQSTHTRTCVHMLCYFILTVSRASTQCLVGANAINVCVYTHFAPHTHAHTCARAVMPDFEGLIACK